MRSEYIVGEYGASKQHEALRIRQCQVHKTLNLAISACERAAADAFGSVATEKNIASVKEEGLYMQWMKEMDYYEDEEEGEVLTRMPSQRTLAVFRVMKRAEAGWFSEAKYDAKPVHFYFLCEFTPSFVNTVRDNVRDTTTAKGNTTVKDSVPPFNMASFDGPNFRQRGKRTRPHSKK